MLRQAGPLGIPANIARALSKRDWPTQIESLEWGGHQSKIIYIYFTACWYTKRTGLSEHAE